MYMSRTVVSITRTYTDGQNKLDHRANEFLLQLVGVNYFSLLCSSNSGGNICHIRGYLLEL